MMNGSLDSGLRYTLTQSEGDVSVCGLVVGVGSRDEEDAGSGMAHFLEHMLFKGTKKRNYYDLVNLVELCGGEFNAYTSKEDTVVYVKIHNDFIDNAIDVLSDILKNSVFPDVEIEKEKDVVLDEISYYEDSPAELIYDEFEERVFLGHPLSNSVLGIESKVESISRKDVKEFYERKYVYSNVVFSYVGSLEGSKLLDKLNYYFNNTGKEGTCLGLKKELVYTPFADVKSKSTSQSHVLIGAPAYTLYDERKYALYVLSNFLGGGSFNSVLNMLLREENGLTYNIETNYTPYKDSGIFSVYFGTEQGRVSKCLDLIYKVFYKLASEDVSASDLEKYKKQLIGSLALNYDNKTSLMIRNGKSILYHGFITDFQETASMISKVSVEDIRSVSEQILDLQKLSRLQYD